MAAIYMKQKTKEETIESLELHKVKATDPVIKASIDKKIKALASNETITK